MKKLIKIIFLILTVMLLFSVIQADQKILMEKQKKELLALNKEILKQIKNKKEFHNKKLYVKLRLSKDENGNCKYKIEDISSEEIKPIINSKTGQFIVEGSFLKGDDNSFKFDIDSVIPPEDISQERRILN